MLSLFAFNHIFILANRFFESYCSYELKDLWNSLQDYEVNLHTGAEILLSKNSNYFTVFHRRPCVTESVTIALPA